MNKKIIAIIVAAVVVIGAVVGIVLGAGGNKNGDQNINFDIDLNSKIALNVLMPNSGKTIEEVNANLNAATVEQVTGYHVNYSQLPASNASSALNLNMIDQAQYHAMKLTNAQFGDMIAMDGLLALDEVIDAFGPAIKEAISEESWDVVRVNGKIYGIPERASSDNIENPVVFRQDWLDALQLSVPTTRDEFTAVLRAFKQSYCKEAGTAPLTFDMYTPLVYAVSASFGIYAEWQEYEINGKKEVRYYMDAPGYVDYVSYMSDLYNEGLIDNTISTNDAATALQKFTTGKSGAIATSLWSVSAIVAGLESSGVISGTEAKGTVEDYLCYLRSLKNAAGEQKVYRTSGYTYITAIPYYMAENAGYVIDWINSKLTDTADKHNFRTIVLGEENVHYTYNENKDEYAPVSGKFEEKDDASYYLTGSNENVYTKYWLARVQKNPELKRAWNTLMRNADEVGVYNLVDFAPPIADYSANRGTMELYAQDQFFVMLGTDKGTSKFSEYLTKLMGTEGGTAATQAINAWYYSK